MNNPFWRLKRYLLDEGDPQENHATECLAACLVFSSKIRDAFIRFWLNDAVTNTDLVEVVTQLRIEGGGCIDLLLRRGEEFLLVVEVKVRSRENCDHHREQLRKYRDWLNKQGAATSRLFTLVRNEDRSFDPKKHGADGRRTWSALYRDLKAVLANEVSDVESNLIKYLLDYLESEAIVSTYETKDLLSYAAGWKARKAVIGIFNCVNSTLEVDGFKTESVEGEGGWPQLKIQHPRWEKIFGEGKNRKISLWFRVPGIWEATEYEFRPEIEIWEEDHGNDWRFAASRLSAWLTALKSQGFSWTVYPTWNGGSRANLSASQIHTEPKRICAARAGNDGFVIRPDQIPKEDDLIDSLVKRLKEYAKIVDSL